MKKFSKILGAAALLLCGLMITGCEPINNIKEALAGPKDTWFLRQVDYKKNGTDTTVKLNVYFCYSDTGFTTETNVEIQPGLTAVVTGSADVAKVLNGLGDNTYIIKNFSNSEETEIEASDDDDENNKNKTIKFKMTPAKWSWMYNFVTLENRGKNIAPFNKENNYKELDVDNLKHISWKKIMASYLLDNLLE